VSVKAGLPLTLCGLLYVNDPRPHKIFNNSDFLAMIYRKLVAYSITLTSGVFIYRALSRLEGEKFFIGMVLFAGFYLVYALPLVFFGANIQLEESGIRVQQYVDVNIPYSEILSCYDGILPPFSVAIIVTRRR